MELLEESNPAFENEERQAYRFHLIPNDDMTSVDIRSNLYHTIVLGGGRVYPSTCSENVVLVLDTRYFFDNPKKDCFLPADVFCSSLVYQIKECRKMNAPLPNFQEYLLTPSKYEPYDVMAILEHQQSWSNLTPKANPPSGSGFSAQEAIRAKYCLRARRHARKSNRKRRQPNGIDSTGKLVNGAIGANDGGQRQGEVPVTGCNRVSNRISGEVVDKDRTPLPLSVPLEAEGSARAEEQQQHPEEFPPSCNDRVAATPDKGNEVEISLENPVLPSTSSNRSPTSKNPAIYNNISPVALPNGDCNSAESPRKEKTTTAAGLQQTRVIEVFEDSEEEDSTRPNNVPGSDKQKDKTRPLNTPNRVTRSSSEVSAQIIPAPGCVASPVNRGEVNLKVKAVAGPSKRQTGKKKGGAGSDADWIDCDGESEIIDVSDVEEVNLSESDKESDSDHGIVKTRPKARPYTLEEGQMMLDLICKYKLYTFVKGKVAWQNIASCKYFRDKQRTYQSLKEHFKKQVEPNVLNKGTRYKITSDNLQRLKRGTEDAKRHPFANQCSRFRIP